MAGNRIKGLTIEIGGDTTKLTDALKGVDNSLKNTQAQLKDVNKLLKLDPKNTELLKQKQDLLARSVDDTKTRLDQLKKAQETMDANGVDKNSDQYKALQREIIETEQQLRAAEKAAKDFGTVMGQQLQVVGGKLKETGEKIAGVGESLTKNVSGPIVAVGAASVAAFNQVDSGLDIIVSKTGATGEAMDEMEASMKKLAAEIPTDFETAGTAIGEVNTRFHLTGDELESLSGKFIKFAEINNTDVNSSIDQTQKVMAAYGLTAEQAGLLLDTFNVVGQNTGISMDSLESAMIKNQAALQGMGLDAFQSAQFIGQLEVSGIDSSVALAGLQKALVNAAKDGKTMDQALGELQKAIANSKTEEEGLQAAIDLFGSKAGPTIYQTCKNGELSFTSLGKNATEAAGSVDSTFNNMTDATDNFKTVVNQVMTLGYEIAKTLMPMIQKAIETITPVIKALTDKWNSLDEGQQEFIIKAAMVVAAIGPVVAAVGKVISIVGSCISVIGSIVSVLGGPLTIAIGAAVTAGVLLWKNWDTVKEKAAALWNSIKTIFNNIKDTISNSINAARDAVKSAIDKIKSFFNFKVEFPKIKMPHFSVSGSANPLKWLSEGVPKLKVEWYRKAEDTPYLFNTPRLIGVGDVPEVVVGKQKFDQMTRGNVTNNITIVQQPGQDANELARVVMNVMTKSMNSEEAVFA